MLGGRAVSSPGAMTSRTAQPSVSLNLEPTTGSTEGKAEEEGGVSDEAESADPVKSKIDRNAVEREKQEREKEDARFDEAEQMLRQAINESPDLRGLKEHLLIDRTAEGLRIQIIDREGQPMFPSASARLFDRTRKLLEQVSKTIQPLPNKVRITGHTDSVPYRASTGRSYGNWELSSDRAQASRRVLIDAGFDPNRINSVAGRADREPLLPDDPASPRNRRISIVLLREPAEAAARAAKAATNPPPGATPSKELKRDWTGPRVR
jgi:chemotaxis protein MotB